MATSTKTSKVRPATPRWTDADTVAMAIENSTVVIARCLANVSVSIKQLTERVEHIAMALAPDDEKDAMLSDVARMLQEVGLKPELGDDGRPHLVPIAKGKTP